MVSGLGMGCLDWSYVCGWCLVLVCSLSRVSGLGVVFVRGR